MNLGRAIVAGPAAVGKYNIDVGKEHEANKQQDGFYVNEFQHTFFLIQTVLSIYRPSGEYLEEKLGE